MQKLFILSLLLLSKLIYSQEPTPQSYFNVDNDNPCHNYQKKTSSIDRRSSTLKYSCSSLSSNKSKLVSSLVYSPSYLKLIILRVGQQNQEILQQQVLPQYPPQMNQNYYQQIIQYQQNMQSYPINTLYPQQGIPIKLTLRISKMIQYIQLIYYKIMRTGLLKNYGPTQIFPDDKQQRTQSLYSITNHYLKAQDNKNNQKSKSVNTYGVEQRDFYDQLRLKGKAKKSQNQYTHKPIFKLKGDNIIVIKQKNRELYPIDIKWNNCQIGRIQGEISGKIDKNYAKIRRYLEGSSSVIDYTETKMYDQYNSYANITNQERFSKDCDIMFRTSNNAQPGNVQSNRNIIRTKFEPDWIQRGKY